MTEPLVETLTGVAPYCCLPGEEKGTEEGGISSWKCSWLWGVSEGSQEGLGWAGEDGGGGSDDVAVY